MVYLKRKKLAHRRQRLLHAFATLVTAGVAGSWLPMPAFVRADVAPLPLPPANADRAVGRATPGMRPFEAAPSPTAPARPEPTVARPGGGPPPAPHPPDDEGSQPVVTVTSPQWVKNEAPTTLWSSPASDAHPFTDLATPSFLHVEGPPQDGRLPVYYAGDGLLRRPGSAWVDIGAARAVDPPPPGEVAEVDAAANRPLPTWVQAHKATPLWSGPDSSAVAFTTLPQWTFLEAAGLERGERLLVNYEGDYATRRPGLGWVDLSAVGPAGDPGSWVLSHRATPLWSGVDDQAQRFGDVPQWSNLRLVADAPADAERVMVEYFGDGGTRQPGVGWVARAAVGPIAPPVPLPAPPTPGRPIEPYSFTSDADFIDSVGAAAERSQRATGVPASVTVAQAILESDWGRSRLVRQGNNLFGIKALAGPGPAGTLTLATWEHLDGRDMVVQAPFKAYTDLEASVDDHGRFFRRNRRYAGALAVAADPRAFARAIQDAGYATDPAYAAKLIRLMDRYDLYRFDR